MSKQIATLSNAESSARLARASTSNSYRLKQWRAFKRNKLALIGLIVLVVVHALAFAAPWIAPYEPQKVNPINSLASPSADHLLGTDGYGRDVFSRLLYGGRISLTVGLTAVVVSLVVGSVVGALSGFFGGWTDTVLMRFTDAMLSIPTFFLLLLVLTIFGGGLGVMILVIGFTSWMNIARVVRGEILRFRDADFVLAARSLGATPGRTLIAHVMPHASSAMIVAATVGVAYAILVESSLSYLGLGIQPPTATWGNMLWDAQTYLFLSPWMSVYPGVMIFVTVLAYNFLGDGLRDALDPHLAK